MDNPFYAACGLNCLNCEARKATIENNDELRKKVAKQWSELNKVEIKPEDINCVGCRIDGHHFAFCESMCPIRKCAKKNKYRTCGECDKAEACSKLAMVCSNNEEARKNLGLKPLDK